GGLDELGIGLHPRGFMTIEVGQALGFVQALGGVLRAARLEGAGLLGQAFGQAFGERDELADAVFRAFGEKGHQACSGWIAVAPCRAMSSRWTWSARPTPPL